MGPLNTRVPAMTAPQPDTSKLLSLTVHELRTPINVANGYLRMLTQFHGHALSDEQRKFVTEASNACGKLTELIADLAVLSKLLSGELTLRFEDVAFFGLAAEAAASVTDGRDRGVQIEVRGAERSATVHGDRTWLQIALRSLVAAVVRDRVQSATVLVDCRRRPIGRESLAIVAIGEQEACSALAALPPARWASFDPWRGGAGVTLPIAAEVVQAHRGRLGTMPGVARHAAVAVALPARG